jgi:hypothetical protein
MTLPAAKRYQTPGINIIFFISSHEGKNARFRYASKLSMPFLGRRWYILNMRLIGFP